MLFFVILVIFSELATAQTKSPIYLKKFFVVLKTGQRFEGHNGVLDSTGMNGQLKSGKDISIQRSNIKTLYASEGSQAGLMGCLCALVGLVCSLYLSYDSNSESKISSEAVILLTTGSGIIGALIGASQKKWKIINLTN